MSYESFDNEHKKQKNLVLIFSGIIIIMLLILLLLIQGKKDYLVYKTAPFIDNNFLERDVCHAGFHSIALRGAVSSLVEKSYLKILKDMNYSAVDFEIDKSDYRFIDKTSKLSCKIIIKDQNVRGHGLRAFVIELNKNQNYIFNYKISSISEAFLSESDLGKR